MGRAKPTQPGAPSSRTAIDCHQAMRGSDEVVGSRGNPASLDFGWSQLCVLVREFFALHGNDKVGGLIIVDSAIVRTRFPEDWPTFLAEASYVDVVGLEKTRGLTEEWTKLKIDEDW